jgi:hypothetical protein
LLTLTLLFPGLIYLPQPGLLLLRSGLFLADSLRLESGLPLGVGLLLLPQGIDVDLSLPLLRLLTRPFLSCGTLSFQLAFSLGLPGQFLLPRLALLIEALEALSLQVLCIAHLGIDIDK